MKPQRAQSSSVVHDDNQTAPKAKAPAKQTRTESVAEPAPEPAAAVAAAAVGEGKKGAKGESSQGAARDASFQSEDYLQPLLGMERKLTAMSEWADENEAKLKPAEKGPLSKPLLLAQSRYRPAKNILIELDKQADKGEDVSTEKVQTFLHWYGELEASIEAADVIINQAKNRLAKANEQELLKAIEAEKLARQQEQAKKDKQREKKQANRRKKKAAAAAQMERQEPVAAEEPEVEAAAEEEAAPAESVEPQQGAPKPEKAESEGAAVTESIELKAPGGEPSTTAQSAPLEGESERKAPKSRVADLQREQKDLATRMKKLARSWPLPAQGHSDTSADSFERVAEEIAQLQGQATALKKELETSHDVQKGWSLAGDPIKEVSSLLNQLEDKARELQQLRGEDQTRGDVDAFLRQEGFRYGDNTFMFKFAPCAVADRQVAWHLTLNKQDLETTVEQLAQASPAFRCVFWKFHVTAEMSEEKNPHLYFELQGDALLALSQAPQEAKVWESYDKALPDLKPMLTLVAEQEIPRLAKHLDEKWAARQPA